MLFTSLIILITFTALPSFNEKLPENCYTRISAIVLLFSAILTLNPVVLQHVENLVKIDSGLAIYGGLFHITIISQIFEIFMFLIGGLILFAWPLVFFNKKTSDFLNYSSNYSLLILFSLLGSSLLISSYDLISMYLSIELQSFAVYVLATLYRNSELSTSAGLKYFLLGGLSSCFIVRLCAFCYYESLRLSYYPYITPVSELGEGESPTLNLASLTEGGTGRNQIRLIVLRTDSSMSKAILPESNLLGASTGGLYHVWDRIYALSMTLV